MSRCPLWCPDNPQSTFWWIHKSPLGVWVWHFQRTSMCCRDVQQLTSDSWLGCPGASLQRCSPAQHSKGCPWLTHRTHTESSGLPRDFTADVWSQWSPSWRPGFLLSWLICKSHWCSWVHKHYPDGASTWKVMMWPEEFRHKNIRRKHAGRGTDHSNPAILDDHSWASQWWISQTGRRVFHPSFLDEFFTTP